jgi:hypothetical protein
LALGQVEKLRKELDLSYTPKFHPRLAYALREMRRIGAFGDMLGDHVKRLETHDQRGVTAAPHVANPTHPTDR